jgi:DNA polymerase-3 subunit delta
MEPFLIDESATLIRQRVHKLGEVESLMLALEAEEDSLIAQLEQPSLFTQIRLVECRITKPSAQVALKLAQILETLYPDTYLLIQAGSLTRQHQQAKWFTQIEQKGVVIPHWPLSPAQFSAWVEQRAKRQGLMLDPHMRQLLLYHTEGNCLAAAQEIDRLRLLAGTPAQFSQQSQFEVSDLCNAALSKQSSRVIKIVSCLKESGTALPLVIWALAQTLRTLPPQRYVALLPSLSLADKQLKSGDMASAWRNVLDVSLHLCGSPIF